RLLMEGADPVRLGIAIEHDAHRDRLDHVGHVDGLGWFALRNRDVRLERALVEVDDRLWRSGLEDRDRSRCFLGLWLWLRKTQPRHGHGPDLQRLGIGLVEVLATRADDRIGRAEVTEQLATADHSARADHGPGAADGLG